MGYENYTGYKEEQVGRLTTSLHSFCNLNLEATKICKLIKLNKNNCHDNGSVMASSIT